MALQNPSERLQSRVVTITNKGTSVTEIYRVDGTDPYIVEGQVDPIGTAHATFSTSFLSDVNIEQIAAADPETGQALAYCLVTYEYAPQDRSSTPNANGEVWVWEITSRTTHIDNVEKVTDQVTFDKDNATGGFLSSIIGGDGDNVKGADVLRPSGSLRVTKYFAASAVDETFRQTLYAMRNTINDAAWIDWEKREVLFLGATVRYDENTAIATVDYNFQFGETQEGVEVSVWKDEPNAMVASGAPDPANMYDTVTLWSPIDNAGTPAAIAPPTTKNVYPFDNISATINTKKLRTSTTDPKQVKPFRGLANVAVANVYQEADFTELQLVGP